MSLPLMEIILKPHCHCAVVYQDNVVIQSSTWHDHMHYPEKELLELPQVRLMASAGK